MHRGFINHRTHVGKALRSIRIDKGLSQEELAHQASVDRTYISIIELGQKSPTLDVIFKVCIALGITPSLLLQEAERHMEQKD
jgi:transcriptional regulator with XRE-family HTH domain